MAVHIVFIPGIGDMAFKVAESFQRNIAAELGHFDAKLHIFHWKGLTSKAESKIKEQLEEVPCRSFFSFTAAEDMQIYYISRLRQMLISYFGDAVFYLSENAHIVHTELHAILTAIAREDPRASVHLVAHSLGSVIAFDLLTSAPFQKKLNLRINTFFTVGSPLALFLLRGKRTTQRPAAKRWINIYDKRDLIATKLNPFFAQCKDYAIRVQRANPLTTHYRYFEDPEVLNHILRHIF